MNDKCKCGVCYHPQCPVREHQLGASREEFRAQGWSAVFPFLRKKELPATFRGNVLEQYGVRRF